MQNLKINDKKAISGLLLISLFIIVVLFAAALFEFFTAAAGTEIVPAYFWGFTIEGYSGNFDRFFGVLATPIAAMPEFLAKFTSVMVSPTMIICSFFTPVKLLKSTAQ